MGGATGSVRQVWPLLDLDARHDHGHTLRVRTKHQRFTVGETRRPLRKRRRYVGEVRHKDHVRSAWKLHDLVLQPRGLRLPDALHALTAVSELRLRLRI